MSSPQFLLRSVAHHTYKTPRGESNFPAAKCAIQFNNLPEAPRPLFPLPNELDPRAFSSQHIQETAMQLPRLSRSACLALLFFATCGSASAQQPTPPKETPAPIPRLTIEITGGDADKPVENASVYLKTQQDRLIKDKKTEVNVKTNMQGIAHVPEPPLGRVLIQVVAEGWKPYGHWYDITDSKQVVKIHLDRPPKWY
jgi:hypothetical protein